MKKTLSVLALCLALLLVFTACSAPAQTTESAASEVSTNSEGRNVTFVLKNLVNPFCVTVKEGAEQAAKDLNVNLSVLTPIQGDNNEELMQPVSYTHLVQSSAAAISRPMYLLVTAKARKGKSGRLQCMQAPAR